jgi:hypothetical protein
MTIWPWPYLPHLLPLPARYRLTLLHRIPRAEGWILLVLRFLCPHSRSSLEVARTPRLLPWTVRKRSVSLRTEGHDAPGEGS